MTDLDEIERAITRRLDSLLKTRVADSASDRDWTIAVKKALGNLGKERGHNVCTSDPRKRFEEEWLFDLVWYSYDGGENLEGVLISRTADQDLFAGVLDQIEMIKKGSTCEKHEVPSNAPFIPDYEKLSVTHLSRLLNIKRARVFQLLETNGLIRRDNDVWVLTEEGKKYGGEVKTSKRIGRFIVWPRDVVEIER